MKRLSILALLSSAVLLTACGGGSEELAAVGGGGGGGGGGDSFVATCKTEAYVAGAVELPTADQIAAYAGTYTGDEGSYDSSFNFVKSGTGTLVIADDGQVSYNGTDYSTVSICIDKTAGSFGKIMYFLVGDTGHFDVADAVDADLGQAWGVSPVDGTTIFTKGLK